MSLGEKLFWKELIPRNIKTVEMFSEEKRCMFDKLVDSLGPLVKSEHEGWGLVSVRDMEDSLAACWKMGHTRGVITGLIFATVCCCAGVIAEHVKEKKKETKGQTE